MRVAGLCPRGGAAKDAGAAASLERQLEHGLHGVSGFLLVHAPALLLGAYVDHLLQSIKHHGRRVWIGGFLEDGGVRAENTPI